MRAKVIAKVAPVMAMTRYAGIVTVTYQIGKDMKAVKRPSRM